MNETITSPNEAAAASAFNKQAPHFDQLYAGNTIIQYKRQRVRDHVLDFLHPASNILELNAGTGEDAVFFAKQGHYVHATDLSPAMLSELKEKATSFNVEERVTHELCSYTQLHQLFDRGPYDLVFSNFAGLNCTNDLQKVTSSFYPLLKPGGYVTLVLLPRFCLWEFLLLTRGKWKTAFRRFSGKKGSRAHIEGKFFRCWYYNPSEVREMMGSHYELISVEGLCTIVPPSYIDGFAEKWPRLYRYLKNKERKLKAKWPFRSIGDYYIITLRKKK